MQSLRSLAVLAAASLPSSCRAHWRLTKPVPRSGGVYENNPLPPDANTQEEWVCRNAQPNPAVQRPTIAAGSTTGIVYGTGKVGDIGHVGDSRAVLARKQSNEFKSEDLTEDHKVNLPKEQGRIESAGGVVEFDGQINHRVWTAEGRGGLCVSRVLGDTVMHGSGVIAVPEIRRVDLNLEGVGDGRGKDLFVLLCSDGVWEFMTSQEACDVVLSYGRDDVQGAIAELVRRSRDLWLQDDPAYADDITAVVAWL